MKHNNTPNDGYCIVFTITVSRKPSGTSSLTPLPPIDMHIFPFKKNLVFCRFQEKPTMHGDIVNKIPNQNMQNEVPNADGRKLGYMSSIQRGHNIHFSTCQKPLFYLNLYRNLQVVASCVITHQRVSPIILHLDLVLFVDQRSENPFLVVECANINSCQVHVLCIFS